MNTQTVTADQLATFSDEFKGRMFFGKGTKAKGRFVSAERRMNGRKVEVMWEEATALGSLSAMDFAVGATLRVESAR